MKRFLLYISFFAFVLWPHVIAAERPSRYVPRILKVKTEADIDSLQELGVDIMRRRGDILLCLFPDTDTDTRGGSTTRRQRPIAPTLDVAMQHYDAGSIQTGTAVGVPYTGKGVVVGLCDIGLDPLHPTFLDSDGKSRIKRVVQYVESEGIRLQLDGDEAYRVWATDTSDMYHATHVCGILGGGGAGTPYVGIASDADIVATVSTLTEVGLLAGVEDIIDYAREVGKPAVINISVGSYTGPHDGTSLFSQYLDMCADDAIIVLSSGNEGSHMNSLVAGFSEESPSVSFRLGNKAWDQIHMYGLTDIWSGSASPLTVTLGLYDSDEKRIVSSMQPFTLTDRESISFSWSGASDGSNGAFPFEGELQAEGGVDPENGRHITQLGYEFVSEELAAAGGWARYVLAVEVSGKPGDEVEVYADGTYTRLTGMPGNPAPSSGRSVSDLATGRNVVSVGMYGNRDSVFLSHPEALHDDETYASATGYVEGATVPQSSYGTLRDGRVTPLTVAPGATLMSAGSRQFLECYPFHPHLREGGTVWFESGGTSMSSPYVAGYIATWLEAVPTLTSADVLRIIAESNNMDIEDSDDPHNGCGYFDPVAGLRLALQEGGVESVGDPEGWLWPDEYVEVYDLAGVKRYAGSAAGLSGIRKGLYVVKTSRGVFKRSVN